MRVERETLRRFPDTGCVLFTIRTYVASLASVAPDALLASALAAMSDDVRDYKDVGEGIDELVAALA